MYRITKGVLMTIIALTALTSLGWADVYTVDNTDPQVYQTLAGALATAAQNTGTHKIAIMPGKGYDTDCDLTVPANVDEIYGVPDERGPVVFTAPTYQTGAFLDVSGTTDLDISAITVENYLWGITSQFGPFTGLHVFDCVFDNNGEDGVANYDGGAFSIHGSDILIEDCDVINGERGIRFGYKYWDASHANTWVGPATALDNITVRHCNINNLEQYAIYFDGKDAPSMNNAVVDINTVDACTDAGIQLWPQGAVFNNVLVQGNVVSNCTWEGILVANVLSGNVLDNEVFNCSKGTVGGAGNTNPSPYGGIYVKGTVTISGNTSYNNGMGTGIGDWGLYVNGYWLNINNNCFWGHAGPQAADVNTTGANWWHDNYYGDIVAGQTSYPLGLSTDFTLKKRTNTPVADPSTVEVWSNTTVEFMWEYPDVCDPYQPGLLALYEFTVTWNPDLLLYLDGDNTDLLPDAGLHMVDVGPGTATFTGVNFDTPTDAEGALAWIEFQAIGLGPATVAISSVYRDPDNVGIPVTNGSTIITLQDTDDPTVEIDAWQEPVVRAYPDANTYSQGCTDGFVELHVTAHAWDNFNLKKIEWRLNDQDPWAILSDGSGLTVADFTTLAVMIDLTDGRIDKNDDNILNVRVKDDAGNPPGTDNYSFYVDCAGPVITSWSMADPNCQVGAEYTNDVTVDVAIVDDDATNRIDFMEFGYTGFPEGPLAYLNPTTFDLHLAGDVGLPPVEGLNTVNLQLTDAYGNLSGWTSTTIKVDTESSSPGGLTLDGGAAKTNDPNGTITVGGTWSAATGSAFYMLTETKVDIECDSPDWIDLPLGDPGPWTFPFDIETTEELHWVFRACLDSAGNVSAIDSASITYDETAPEITDLLINNDDRCTNSSATQITVTWDAGEYPDVDEIGLSLTPDGPYTPFAATTPQPITFPVAYTGDGDYWVYGVLRDDLDNESVTEASDDIYVDGVNPTLTSADAQDQDYPSTDPPIYTHWSNDAEITLTLVGLPTDVEILWIREDGGTYERYDVPPPPLTDPYYYPYTFIDQTEQVKHTIDVYAEDCSGRTSPTVSTFIYFDMAPSSPPTINSVTVTSEDPTDVLCVDVEIDATDDYSNGRPWKYRISESGFAWTAWTNYSVNPLAPPCVALNAAPGDVTRTICVEASDRAGNVTSDCSATVVVDQEPPDGSFSIEQSDNDLAADGFTNSLTVCIIDIDCTESGTMKIKNSDGSNATEWILITETHCSFDLACGGCGTRTVWIRFQDDAGNFSDWGAITADIEFRDQVLCPPAPPIAGATGVPGGSTAMSWTANTNGEDQFYYLKHTKTGLYPTYDDGPALAPGQTTGDTLEGLFTDMIPGTTHEFPGPNSDPAQPPDIYSHSIWTIDMAGNISDMPNFEIVETNYVPGDVDLDGTVEGVDDFGVFAMCYGEPSSCNPYCDFGPTNDASGTGYPIPDLLIDVEDLAIIGINFDEYGKRWKGPEDFGDAVGNPVTPSEISLQAVVPGEIQRNSEFVVSITADNVEAIKVYQLILEYDRDNLELVSVERGEVHNSVEMSFFHHQKDAENVDVTGMVMGRGVAFEGDELARLIFRSSDGSFDLEAVELTLRDRQNNPIEAALTTACKPIVPSAFSLSQNYPNPFNPVTTIEFGLPTASSYTLSVYNIAGQVVETFEGHAQAGVVSVVWNATGYSSGVYFYKLEAGEFGQTNKMILLK